MPTADKRDAMSVEQEREFKEFLKDLPVKPAFNIGAGIKVPESEIEFSDIEKQRADALELLCGEILAALRANLLRGTITTEDDQQFERLLNVWSERLATTRKEV